MGNLRTDSRNQWDSSGENPTVTELELGAQMRMADALETIAKDKCQLESDLKYFKAENRRLQARNETYRRQVATYKGLYKKEKNKAI